MTDPIADLTETAITGLTGLATAALMKMERARALELLDAVLAGTAIIRYGVMTCGRDTEFAGYIEYRGQTIHLFTLTRTEPPEPRLN
ncbi:hypothetical protein [Azoarcus olearius]|uniref:Uncharacterized protein n=1 Tax=Azoarcus sp. (strain BH72) TaxID=418699 RepID=A1K6N0_AZOSB|nr:hypothetical protein [Azoarcus olearius]CAL94485.1 Hypothetical protein azo1868 [Azoarcus olearius]